MVSATSRNHQLTSQKKYRPENRLLPTFRWYTSYFLFARIAKLRVLYLLEMIFSKACLEQWKRCNKDLSWRLKEMSTLLFHQWGKIFKFSRWSQLSTEFIFGFLIFLVTRDFLWRFNYFTLSCLVNQTLTRTGEQLLHVFFIIERRSVTSSYRGTKMSASQQSFLTEI